MEGEVARGDPHAWKSAKDGSGAVGCMGLPLDRSAAGFLFVSAGGTLANATICRFCGCFCRKWIKCGAGGQVAHGGVSLICSRALSAS